MILHKLFSTVFGIGYIGKGGGTIAATIVCVLWVLIPSTFLTVHFQLILTAVICAAGVWSGNVVEVLWGKDSNKVVVDEVAGMLVTLILIPITFRYVLTGLFLFRIFDIAKPLFIKKMELLPGGWGVMGDDVLAGIYAHLVLMLIVELNIY